MRCVLLYNPVAGVARSRRLEQLRDAADVLSSLGHAVDLMPTAGPGSATHQAREAARTGAEIVFACGGDGTIHEVMQGLISEAGTPSAALGIIPLGSANALARHLRLSLDPRRAVLQQMQGAACTVPVGRLQCGDQVRYFIVMAGAGPDGALVYRLLTAHKSQLGRWAYYLNAARLFTTRRFHPFEVEYTEAESKAVRTRRAVSAMAVRVDDLGGLFSRLAGRGASIRAPHLRLLILRPPGLISLPMWFVSGWLGLHRINPFFTAVNVRAFSCLPLAGPAPHFQADGEWMGRIPMKASIVPGALRMLLPQK